MQYELFLFGPLQRTTIFRRVEIDFLNEVLADVSAGFSLKIYLFFISAHYRANVK